MDHAPPWASIAGKMVELSDELLARRSQRGEVEAFGILVQRYQGRVFNVCYRLMGEAREAEDLAQETFIRAYEKLYTFDANRPFGPWISRVATNLCLNQLQRVQAVPISLNEERVELLMPTEQSPEALHSQQEESETLRIALLALPPAYRVVVELRHFQGLSYQQIATTLALPLSDVKSHLFRARRALARILRNDE